MKIILALFLTFNATLLVWMPWTEPVVHADGVPIGNGDVNGDGVLDLSDAIYILNYKYLGGPAPIPYQDPDLLQQIATLEADLAARTAELANCTSELSNAQAEITVKTGDLIACTSALTNSQAELAAKTAALDGCSSRLSTLQAEFAAKSADLNACSAELALTNSDLVKCATAIAGNCALPSTGLTICYSFSRDEIDCASTDFPGQDAAYRAGCPMESRYLNHSDGTVTDTCTGLMWLKETAAGGTFDWSNALKYCENLEFAGHSDWRLPNIRELDSIVDHGRIEPASDPMFGFPPVDPSKFDFWSSTTTAENHLMAWHVNFLQGRPYPQMKDVVAYIRAVRNGS